METMTLRPNYRIGTDVLTDGRVKATAHGRKTNVRTFPVGTAQDVAALTLATKIEGERIAEVREVSSSPNGNSRDWAIFVNQGS
jgi:hypothetical protein